jgi:hypothetical protein
MKKPRYTQKRDLNPKVEQRLRTAVVGSRPTSSSYLEFLAERTELLKHKWLESEKVGHDIGSDCAINSWIQIHRKNWLRHRVDLFRATHPTFSDQRN